MNPLNPLLECPNCHRMTHNLWLCDDCYVDFDVDDTDPHDTLADEANTVNFS